MEIDPIYVALATALSTVAGLFYRSLREQITRERQRGDEWEERYFRQEARTDLALDEAERRER